ncbi:MAG TPA: hypothetical protein VLQ91_23255 [Draconibacterium sp.]|nr:hypothetical protein [Draconibacterium sp.]
MTKSILFVILLYLTVKLFAQETPESKKQLNFFLDCYACDFTFVRQELEFVSFVRDPKLADVHILSSQSHAGSGGHKYFIQFIGMNSLKGKNFDFEYLAEPSETDDEIRKNLLKLIQTGILQYYSINGSLKQIEIDLNETGNREAMDLVVDPWNLWVFQLEAGSFFQVEETQNEYTFNTEIRIDKVTEAWKTRFEGRYQIYRENYFDDGEKIENYQNETEINASYIKSLSPHWSAGIFGGYSSQTYLNIKHLYEFAPGIEYNIFPWDVSNRKIFTFRYQAGIRNYYYNEITIYDKLSELLFYEQFSLNLELVQPWGTVETGVEARHYFHDFSKSRLILDSELSVRLTKQFSVFCELEAQVVHDQLYLPKGDASLEDILLERRKQATTYELGGQVGFRFTFGSIYNSVVNERF